jgi:hypothetical protein
MNKNMEFEFGFYTPGTSRARLTEGSNAIREGKAPELKRKSATSAGNRRKRGLPQYSHAETDQFTTS